MNTRSNETTLVVGGAGKTGRRVAQRLTACGIPVKLVEPIHNAHVTEDVQRVLGRRPRDFGDFAVAAAEAWR